MKYWAQILFVWAGLTASVTAAAAPVHLEIAQEAAGAIDGPQRWLQSLKRLSLASIRVRSARVGERPAIQQRGSTDRPTFHVTAVLTARNELKVPDRIFRLEDMQSLSRWLDDLQSTPHRDEARGAFGLAEQELVNLRKDLAATFPNSTVDRPTRGVLDELLLAVTLPIVIDPNARKLLSDAPVVQDEFQGLAQGSALAAALRPAGLAFVPRRNEQGAITLHIVAANSVDETWPIGWPSTQSDQEAVPKLFEFVPVEIADVPLSQALNALKPRLGVPLLLDHNGLAARRIDPQSVKVRYPAGRTFYKKLIDRLLFQARLEMVVKVDEANRPILWIRPIQR
jgi:hypothetical protein